MRVMLSEVLSNLHAAYGVFERDLLLWVGCGLSLMADWSSGHATNAEVVLAQS